MLKLLLSVLGIAVPVFIIIAALQPDEMTVSRTTMINAPAEDIFEQINNLHNWNSWSPWAKIDPKAKVTFEGPESGVGAKMSWDSTNSDVGAGSMTIADSRPNEMIDISLVFTKPMSGTSTSTFKLAPKNGQTEVTWSMNGPQNFIGKAMGLVFNCQKMIEDMYDKGFVNLKAVVERK